MWMKVGSDTRRITSGKRGNIATLFLNKCHRKEREERRIKRKEFATLETRHRASF